MEKLKILLIEDDADDVQLLEEALQENHVAFDLYVIMDGDKVLPYLQSCITLPDIIVMDLNLPKVHGKDLLSIIRSTSRFVDVPLVVLTTSASPFDIQFAHDNGANKFITKPSSISGFNNTVEVILAAATRQN
jgi:DNA-binding response OmpR family regulator